MTSIKYLDINALGDSVGAEKEDFVLPGGGVMTRRLWTPADLLNAMPQVDAVSRDAGSIVVSGGAPTWAVGAIACRLRPYPLIYRAGDPSGDLPIPDLPMGEPDPAAGIKFSLLQKENRLMLEFLADDPSLPTTNGPHNYDLSRLKSVIVPAVPENVHLFIRSHGAFPVSMAISRAYAGKCRSIFMIFGDDEKFTCAASFCPEFSLGDRAEF